MHSTHPCRFRLVALLATLVLGVASAHAAGPQQAVSYQGELRDAGLPAAGPADLRFTLFDAETDGSPIGLQVELLDVPLTDGRFTVLLDFGIGAFNGQPRYVEIEARHPAGVGEYVLLTPRQPVTPVPYAQFAFDGTGGGGSVWDLLGDAAVYLDGPVGVGTPAPESLMHVQDGESGLEANANAPFNIERDTTTFIGIMTPSTVASGILFGNPAGGTAAGALLYNTSLAPDGMELRTNGNITRMTLAGDGNVGIGTTDPQGLLHVEGETGNGSVLLPDSSISAVEMLNEPGIARDVQVNNFPLNSGTWTTIASRTITCPSSGYVLAFSTAEIFNQLTAQVDMNLTQISNNTTAQRIVVLPAGQSLVNLQAVFQVTAGNETVYFRAASNGSFAIDPELTLLFIPTAYGVVDVTE